MNVHYSIRALAVYTQTQRTWHICQHKAVDMINGRSICASQSKDLPAAFAIMNRNPFYFPDECGRAEARHYKRTIVCVCKWENMIAYLTNICAPCTIQKSSVDRAGNTHTQKRIRYSLYFVSIKKIVASHCIASRKKLVLQLQALVH